MAENVKVIVRCRPKSKNEMEMKSKSIVKIDKCSVTLENPADLQAPDKSFVYDSAYDSNTATETIYNDICYSLVENVLEGYNGTIFAYGQTGCGKSYTMQGPEELLKNPPKNDPILAHRGIISRSFDHIFEAISVVSGVQYLAMVSYLEIYNENIRDLLNPLTPTSSLSLKEIPGEGIIIQNLSTQTVHNAQECENLLNLGNNNRIVGATLMNAASSRSHSIFTISLEQIAIDNNNNDCQSAGASIKKGKLNLVDLAGSERQNKTGATGDRLKEATKINLSLSALGNVISALVDGKTKHIPYRDSKLTRLLQDSLGGNTKTLMIACISPVEYNYDETLSTLRYASRAKNIHNKPKINEDPKDTILREYQEEILRLKEQLANSTKLNGIHQLNDHPVQNHQQMAINNESFELEKEKLRREYEAETFRLKLEHDAQREQKDELVKDMENLREHYEEQLKTLQESISQNNKNNNNNNCTEDVVNKMKIIKDSLIGGERADDIQFKEKRIRRKIAAENRMSDLTNALNRIEQSADRDLLQGHYSSIQQELQAKTDALKSQRQKVRALEREISDLQSEFQLDRTDYLETIRRLEKNLKFYQQLMDKTLPLLRKEGRFWDVDSIKQQSDWNDDLNKWKLPEDLITSRMKLPPAVDPLRYHVGRQNTLSSTAPGRLERSTSIQLSQSSSSPTSLSSSQSNISIPSLENIQQEERIISAEDDYFLRKKLDHHSDNEDIVENYFKPRRTVELIQESKLLNHKDFKNNNNYHSALLNKRKDIWPKTSIITSTLSWYNNIAAGHNNNTSNNNWDGQRNIKTSMDARDRSSVYDWNNIIKTATNNENKLLTKKIIPPRPQAATPAARINRQPSST